MHSVLVHTHGTITHMGPSHTWDFTRPSASADAVPQGYIRHSSRGNQIPNSKQAIKLQGPTRQ